VTCHTGSDWDNLPKIPNNFKDYLKMQTNSFTEQIFNCTAPYNNPYQGNPTRLLFVCSAGLLRSPTGAHVGALRGYNTRSCGSHNDYALIPLSANLIMWARHIIFVNRENHIRAMEVFSGTGYEDDIRDKAIVLDIPDRYEAFSNPLVRIWNEWFDGWEATKN
jgi:predicted protein tyrosine phosphatase